MKEQIQTLVELPAPLESSESRKIVPLITRSTAAPNAQHEQIMQRPEKHATARIEILAFGTGHPTMPPIVPLSREHLTGLSILTIKDSNSQALNRAQLWILWTIKHPVTYRTCIQALYSFESSVDQLGEHYPLETVFHLIKIKGGSRGWRCLSGCFDRLDAKVCPPAAVLLDLGLAEPRSSTMLSFMACENGGASLGILLNLLLVPAQRVA